MEKLGRDPELTKTNSGLSITKFSIATNRKAKTANGEYSDKTQWHNLVAFGKLAEICNQYLKKGHQCSVEGEIEYTNSVNSEGVKKYYTNIICNEVHFLEKRQLDKAIEEEQARPNVETNKAYGGHDFNSQGQPSRFDQTNQREAQQAWDIDSIPF